MKKCLIVVASLFCIVNTSYVTAADDQRQMVKLPDMMVQHMLGNMRNHLESINEILINMSKGKLDEAGELAEFRLGMSSLETHGARHMAQFMPKKMQEIGTSMHHAASHFALKAQEGDAAAAYSALTEVTSACVSCHAAFRIR